MTVSLRETLQTVRNTIITVAQSNLGVDDSIERVISVLGTNTGSVTSRIMESVGTSSILDNNTWMSLQPVEKAQALLYWVNSEIRTELSEAGFEDTITFTTVYETSDDFNPYTDPDTIEILERAGIATYKYRS